MIRYLSNKVETLREKMIQLAMEKGSLLDEEVVAISQQLDKELVKLQRLMMNKRRIGTKLSKGTKTSKIYRGQYSVVSLASALQNRSRKSRSAVSGRRQLFGEKNC